MRIVEGTSSTNKASTDISKQFKHSNEAGLGPLIKNIPEIGYNSTQSGKASGASNISSSLITTVTATVTKVLDSGNLEITADRELMTNGEKQHITLSAVVRPLDIGSDNSVSSTYLADVKVACSGKGAIGDRQREGIITKILGFLF